MHILYNLLVSMLLLVSIPVLLFRLFRETGFGRRLKQSFGFLPEEDLTPVAGKQCIWLHAASVGEIVAASPIVKEIRRQFPARPILVSVVTASGYAMAKRIVPADSIVFFPLDLPWLSRRVVKAILPAAFLLVETELWPNFLYSVRQQNIPVLMVNGRISDRSVGRYRYLGGLLQQMLDTVDRFCMQSTIDAQYIIRLGADPRKVFVTGNTKFDQTYTEALPEEKLALEQELGLDTVGPVVVAGSTHKGEEELLLKAFYQVKKEFPHAGIILAPRDIMRAGEVVQMAREMGFSADKRTVLTKDRVVDVVVLDTIGELGKVYSLGEIVYVGGSLVSHGGHNILEPAAHGKPILVGPHMFNFKDSYALFSGRKACVTVYDGGELAQRMLELLKDSALRETMAAETLKIIGENRGAASKSVEHLQEIMEAKEGKNS
ncbi:3-deoxy-D-manno-octulosonic acid transferase [Azotosporobacter soli]|uniref:3-deoxy-D-manno-octulosonic acid transferase n=1 Tax=Azotosporobacter soli TaxID=3055040 RepID=UPI0031FE7B43